MSNVVAVLYLRVAGLAAGKELGAEDGGCLSVHADFRLLDRGLRLKLTKLQNICEIMSKPKRFQCIVNFHLVHALAMV